MTRARTQGHTLLVVSTALAGATVLAQIAYPLTPDRELGRLSVVTVLLACAAGLAHAGATWGAERCALFTVVVVVGAFAIEAAGVATGFPFGHYMYAHSLGPMLLGVPLLVPMAWLMLAYPSLVLGRALVSRTAAPQRDSTRPIVSAFVAAAAMAAWDVFLDPQMVAAGHWTWRDPSPALPGVTRVPLTNLAGWLGSAALLMVLTETVLRRVPSTAGEDRADLRLRHATPAILVAWAWLGGVVGNAAFFDRPAVAAWGGLLLGVLVGPYLLLVRRGWTA